MIVRGAGGEVVGEVVLWMRAGKKCPFPGKHGYLLYAFIPTGEKEPAAVACDPHCHDGEGIYGGLLAKVML